MIANEYIIESLKSNVSLKKYEKNSFYSGITGQDGSYLSEILLDKGYLYMVL